MKIHELCSRCLWPFIGKPGICPGCAKELQRQAAQPADRPAPKPCKTLPLFDDQRSAAKGGSA